MRDYSDRYRGSDVSFLFKIGSSRNIKRISLILTWKSESLITKIVKSSMDTL